MSQKHSDIEQKVDKYTLKCPAKGCKGVFELDKPNTSVICQGTCNNLYAIKDREIHYCIECNKDELRCPGGFVY